MSKGRSGAGALLCVTAALCVSVRAALSLLTVIPLLLLFAQAALQLLRYGRLTVSPYLSLLLAGGVGGFLWLVLRAFLPDIAAALGQPLPVLAVFRLCGVAGAELAEQPEAFRPTVLIRAAVALLLTGAIREVLAQGSLAAYPLPVTVVSEGFGRAADGTIGVGGLLAAGVMLWLFRLQAGGHTGVPVLSATSAGIPAAVTAIVCAAQVGIRVWMPAVSALWRFWVAVLLTAVLFTLAEALTGRNRSRSPVWAVVPPVAAWLIPAGTVPWSLVWAVLAGVITGVAAAAVTAMAGRMRRLAPSFGGSPAALTTAGILLAAVSALV